MEFFAGDTVEITFSIQDSVGNAKDLVGASVEFAIGHRGAPLVEIESPDEAIVWTAPSSGELKIVLSGERTQKLAPGRGRFVGTYQLRVTDVAGIGSTVVTGEVTCKASVVR